MTGGGRDVETKKKKEGGKSESVFVWVRERGKEGASERASERGSEGAREKGRKGGRRDGREGGSKRGREERRKGVCEREARLVAYQVAPAKGIVPLYLLLAPGGREREREGERGRESNLKKCVSLKQ